MSETSGNPDVEIKVSLSGEAAEAARKSLKLDPDDGNHRTVHFWDRPRRSDGAGDGVQLPLLDRGAVIRLRAAADGGGGHGDGGDEDDLTAKLRPCDPDTLPAEFRVSREEDGQEFKIEEDWTGRSRVWAASLKVDGRFDRPAPGRDDRPAQPRLSREQRALLACAGAGEEELDGLTALGPIDSVQWKPSRRDLIHPVTVELWSVGDGLSFLELSLRTSPAEASGAQDLLVRTLVDRGFEPPARQESKTRAAMTALALSLLGDG
ncbi:hypothetical protein OG871_03765 [Kitasatospora sp. NBC_00374]|uniref:hypothetical protein n=1 Tax=Kitasatospora sp. NBC_00374 TaxID=2975964 RepID=UPI0030E568F9